MFSVAFWRLAGAKIDTVPVSCLPLPGCSPALCPMDTLGPGSGFPRPPAWDVQATQQSTCSHRARAASFAGRGCPCVPGTRAPGQTLLAGGEERGFPSRGPEDTSTYGHQEAEGEATGGKKSPDTPLPISHTSQSSPCPTLVQTRAPKNKRFKRKPTAWSWLWYACFTLKGRPQRVEGGWKEGGGARGLVSTRPAFWPKPYMLLLPPFLLGIA